MNKKPKTMDEQRLTNLIWMREQMYAKKVDPREILKIGREIESLRIKVKNG